MKNILLTISYDGTNYCGWQRQSRTPCGKKNTQIFINNVTCKQNTKQDIKTVQEEIETVLSKILKVHIPLTGSGRTDSGVHAMGQAANFFCPVDSFPPKNFPRALNAQLPLDIRIMAAREVPLDFSARFSATSRTYRYFLMTNQYNQHNDSNMNGFISAIANRYTWGVNCPLNIEKLNEVSKCLLGEKDCKTFCAAGDSSLSTKRYIECVRFFNVPSIFNNINESSCEDTLNNKYVVFEIKANAFLYHMIRSLVGTFVELSRKNTLDEFCNILHSCDRSRVLTTAPAKGLFLWNVEFDGVRRH